jgi:ribokinase
MNPTKSGIVVIGSLNMDFVVRVDRLPKAGETVGGNSFHTTPGGKGANQAVAAGRLRSPFPLRSSVWMVGCIGQDMYGEQLAGSLLSSEVKTNRLFTTAEAPTGVALITVEESGQNQIVVAPGANDCLRPVDAADALAEIDGSHLLLQLEIPQETVSAAVRQGRRQGMVVLLDPAPARPLAPALLRDLDLLTPNESEALTLLGLEGAQVSIEDAPQLARRLQELGPRQVILKLGERGCVLANATQLRHFPARAVQAIDATAAGDCFNGALAVALSEGKSIEAATQFANCAASIAVTRIGAQEAMPYRQEVDAFLIEKA